MADIMLLQSVMWLKCMHIIVCFIPFLCLFLPLWPNFESKQFVLDLCSHATRGDTGISVDVIKIHHVWIQGWRAHWVQMNPPSK